MRATPRRLNWYYIILGLICLGAIRVLTALFGGQG